MNVLSALPGKPLLSPQQHPHGSQDLHRSCDFREPREHCQKWCMSLLLLCTVCSSLHGPSCSLEAVCWRTNYKTTHSSEEMPGWFRGIEQRSPVVRNKPWLCSSHFVFSGWLVTATSLISNRKHALTPPHTHTQNGDSTLHMAALLWRSYINILIYSLRKGLLKFHHIPRTLPKPVGKIQAK